MILLAHLGGLPTSSVPPEEPCNPLQPSGGLLTPLVPPEVPHNPSQPSRSDSHPLPALPTLPDLWKGLPTPPGLPGRPPTSFRHFR